MNKKQLIFQITEALQKCDDPTLLDLIYKILLSQT